MPRNDGLIFSFSDNLRLAKEQLHVDIGPGVGGRDYFVRGQVPEAHGFIEPDRRFKDMVRFQIESSRTAGSAGFDDGLQQLASNASSLASRRHCHFCDFKFAVTHATKSTAANASVIDHRKKYLAA